MRECVCERGSVRVHGRYIPFLKNTYKHHKYGDRIKPRTFFASGISLAPSEESGKVPGPHRLDEGRLPDAGISENLHLDFRNGLSCRDQLFDVIVTAILKDKHSK